MTMYVYSKLGQKHGINELKVVHETKKHHKTLDQEHITLKGPQGSIKLPTLWSPTIQTIPNLKNNSKKPRSISMKHKGWNLKIHNDPKDKLKGG